MHVIIMCKAPVAGAVKTRLIGPYSAEQAADLHTKMAAAVIQRAVALFEHVSVAADDPEHPFFSPFDAPTVSQGEGDLGARMDRLMKQAFNDGAEAVMFLGTDSPHMQDRRLLEATRLLNSYDVVLGPVEDGGYDLIATTGSYPLFSNISWSSELVLIQTLDRVRKLKLSCQLLEQGFDIDRPEDVERAGWKPI